MDFEKNYKKTFEQFKSAAIEDIEETIECRK